MPENIVSGKQRLGENFALTFDKQPLLLLFVNRSDGALSGTRTAIYAKIGIDLALVAIFTYRVAGACGHATFATDTIT